MKKFIFFFLIVISISCNILYFIKKWEEKKHKDEFFSLFTVKQISYEEGFNTLRSQLNLLHVDKHYHLIHIWDTTFLEDDFKVNYIKNLDNSLNKNDVSLILMSSMTNNSIESCLNTRNIKFKKVIVLNEMEDFISGLCNLRKRQRKPSSATILINSSGKILYYNDKLLVPIHKDSVLLNIVSSIN